MTVFITNTVFDSSVYLANITVTQSLQEDGTSDSSIDVNSCNVDVQYAFDQDMST